MSPRVIKKTRSILISIVTVCAIIGASGMVIAYGRGYRLDFKKTSLRPTGLISATSDPIGAQVYVDDSLRTATNNSFNVDPGWYTVTISKEGYISWQKKLRVQGEVVSRADAFLFPGNPSLSPLTTLGLTRPILSPDGTKITYVIPQDHLDNGSSKKAGLWVYELSDGPLGRNRDPVQLASADPSFDFMTATMLWSPDSTTLLAQNPTTGTTHLYAVNKPGAYTDATASVQSLLTDWQEERSTKEHQKLEAFKQPVIDMATMSAKVIAVSPDETRILYEATASATIPKVIVPPLIGTNPTEENRNITPGNIYVYDGKEDRNYLILAKEEIPKPTPTPTPSRRGISPTPTPLPVGLTIGTSESPIQWFPTSKHLLLTLPGKIDVMEFDRTNWITVYSGPFVDGFVVPWNNGSRIVIMTNLNPNATSLPNLYTVNLR